MNNSKRPLQFDAVVNTPFGAVGISVSRERIATELLFGEYESTSINNPLVKQTAHDEAYYFTDANHQIKLPLAKGTPFQERVWNVISAIPAGQVRTYQQIAIQIDSGARAVANVCGANHQPIIVPCHRVVAKSSLGGFMCGNPNGKKIKTWLLQHESVTI
ncbi:MAG: methylated-DNA-[protein]-cysteine S-methyltransferase [Methylophilaceae bacterium]|jgi:methylated-DNA-[protein]-cysteine S-methyltransferase